MSHAPAHSHAAVSLARLARLALWLLSMGWVSLQGLEQKIRKCAGSQTRTLHKPPALSSQPRTVAGKALPNPEAPSFWNKAYAWCCGCLRMLPNDKVVIMVLAIIAWRYFKVNPGRRCVSG
jgi:hypothetical protein